MRRERVRKGFAALVHDRRRELRLTQDEVARHLGVHPNFVGYLEKGIRRPSATTLIALCRLLNLDRRKVLQHLHPRFKDVAIRPSDGPRGQPYSPPLAELRHDRVLRRRYSVTEQDLRNLARLDAFGQVSDSRDYIRFLNLMRDLAHPPR